VEVTVPEGETLLDVAEANGIPITSLCRGGTCGTCKAKLLAGQPAIATSYALTDRQRQLGFILTCSARTTAGQRIVLDL
jgi:ferredoxin